MTDDIERRAGYGEITARLDGIIAEQKRTAGSIERIERAIFTGNGQTALLSRVTALETRGAPTRAERGGVIGTALGAAIVAVLAYLGIKPGGQQ